MITGGDLRQSRLDVGYKTFTISPCAFIRFHGVRHPATLGSSEVEAFLSWLANERKVSVSTHRQALAALLFFYGKVLCTDLPWLQEIGRPRPSRRLPVVLTPDEVVRILGFLEGEHRLFAQLLYGTGMRISEGLPYWLAE